MRALRSMIGDLDQRVLGDEILCRQIPLLHLAVPEVTLDSSAVIEDRLGQIGQRVIDAELRLWIGRVSGPYCAVIRRSKRILETVRPIADNDLRSIKDSISCAKRQLVTGFRAPGKPDSGREIFVVLIGEAARHAVLAGEQLLPRVEIEAGDPVIAIDGPPIV